MPVDLDLAYCVQNIVGHLGAVGGMRIIAEETFGIDFEFDIFMNLPVDVETGIVNAEIISVIAAFRPYTRATKTHVDGHPLGIVNGPLRLARHKIKSIRLGRKV